MDWHSSEFKTSYQYVQVDRSTFADKQELEVFENGGQIDRKALTATKVSGYVPFVSMPEIGNDFLRIYLTAEAAGQRQKVALGTFLVSAPSSTLTGKRDYMQIPLRTGAAALDSLLRIVDEQHFSSPVSLSAGTLAIGAARAIVEAEGLSVVADSSTVELQKDMVFDSGENKLDAINMLLEYAGFSSLDIDGYGTARMRRYVDPALLSAAVVWSDRVPGCTFVPEVKHEFDKSNVPNKVIAIYSSEQTTMTAVAINDDPGNQYSTVSRGREVTHVETVSEVESQAALEAKARQVLISLTSAVEHITIEHSFEPFELGDGAMLDYSAAGQQFSGVVVSSSMKLAPSMPCTTGVRRFVRM